MTLKLRTCSKGRSPLLAVSSALLLAAGASAQSHSAACAALGSFKDRRLEIKDAALIPGGPLEQQAIGSSAPGQAAAASFPEHCRVQGSLDDRTGADGLHYAIRFELRIPAAWNGRLLFQGGGGLDGSVAPAIGPIAVFGSSAPPALARGYAVVSMDGGHEAGDGPATRFTGDSEAELDYAYAAVGKVVVAAKRIVASYEKREPSKTYFMGCSNGGREAMIAASRYPLEFDGIVAGDPAFNLAGTTLLSHAGAEAFAKVAPRAADGSIALWNALTQADWELLRRGVLDACDANDGARDGMIFDHASCHFDPATLACKAGQANGCLSEAKVAAVQAAFRGLSFTGLPAAGLPAPGLPDQAGNAAASAWPYDAGLAEPGYRAWRTGLPTPDGKGNLEVLPFVDQSLTQYLIFPPTQSLLFQPIDYADIRHRMEPNATLTDVTTTDYRSFYARGGKMLFFTGWSDPVFTPYDLTALFSRLLRDDRSASSHARLFLVPGMNHCGGGPALDNFDPLTSLEQWDASGLGPEQMLATGKGFPGVSRPLCAYPKSAHYKGSGDQNAAANFDCR